MHLNMTAWSDLSSQEFSQALAHESAGNTLNGQKRFWLSESSDVERWDSEAESFFKARKQLWLAQRETFSSQREEEKDSIWEFSWPGQGTNPMTFTGSSWWLHPSNSCSKVGTRIPFALFLMGCPECGAVSCSMVRRKTKESI